MSQNGSTPESEPPASTPIPPPSQIRKPSVTRILEAADFRVSEFTWRYGLTLDLSETLAAAVHLLRHCQPLALTRLKVLDERWEALDPWEREVTISDFDDDMGEEFGPVIEELMTQLSDVVLYDWAKRGQRS